MSRQFWMVVSISTLVVVGAVLEATRAAAQAKPVFDSRLVTSDTKGHAVDVDVDVTGAKELYLVVTDGGNGYGCDWADWAEPRLVGRKGDLKLTELKWKSASADWGDVRNGKNAGGGPLAINGKEVSYGIGTHANSVIAFDLPAGYTRFKARAGLDNGGTDQAGGRATSVQFLVYLEKPPAAVASVAAGDSGKRDAADALAGLDVAEGLAATLFAAEPTLLSPTNIDVDARGRVWVCEVVNYRHRNDSRPEGDRILILEDTNGDGVSDKTKVFYQGRDIDSAMGICVLGNKVIVSCSPNVFVFTDENGDDKPDGRELLFTNTGQAQHDHSAHAFVFGPDGWLYWNFGNAGQKVMDKNGKQVVEVDGNAVVDNGKPYFGGMVFRCRMDGSEFQVLAHNFRNNYEVTVDSFGTLWQSDNDDDGNRGVRINYVMEHGNFGYRDEMTGAGWQSPRTNIEDDIQRRHWHQNDPGVVPNLLPTGAGSPTGICVYEGRLLPKPFWDQVIHCDAGPNVVRAYPAAPDGAGYKAQSLNILYGARDPWFRPADVCVAPDGSLFVADWYDPGVGGHRMGDIDKGRIFRVAPPNTPYKVPAYDFETARGAGEALASPNQAVRYLAWQSLHKMGKDAEKELAARYLAYEPRLQARYLWLLGLIPGKGEHYVNLALNDKNPDIRITALRLARSIKLDVIPVVEKLASDASPAVRRECAIVLRGHKSPEAPRLWAELAAQHDGKDRWYLEALGIGAHGQWDAFLGAWLKKVGDGWNTPAGRDILWRSRAAVSPDYLARIIADPKTSTDELLRYLRAFDFLAVGDDKQEALLQLAVAGGDDGQRRALISGEALKRVVSVNVSADPALAAALDGVLAARAGSREFVELVDKFSFAKRYPDLVLLAEKDPDQPEGVEAARVLLAKGQQKLLSDALAGQDSAAVAGLVRALGNSADGRSAALLLPILSDDKRPEEVRRQTARGLARTRRGTEEIVRLAKAGKLADDLKQAAALELHLAAAPELKADVEKLFPLPAAKESQPLPPIAQLVKMKGDVARGRQVFATTGTCAKCHVVGGEGKEVGPNLSEIGGKLSREALFDSILYPSAGISHNYETHSLLLSDGTTVTGIITSETAQGLSIKNNEGLVHTFRPNEIEQKEKQKISLMPADLQKLMSAQDLLDVVEYMATLKKAGGATSGGN
ncbi:MAG: NPCBM/NEW2 domain-containing protein [Planctomycetia bacterium]|nr:NPCBM/NEW2 domain-containing protein [Planctomycetia bacterium]